MRDLLNNKKFLSVYLVWILIHTFLLLQNDKSDSEKFWPFGSISLNAYDISEWFVYVFAPIVVLYLVFSFSDKNLKLILILLFFNFLSYAQNPDYVLPIQPISVPIVPIVNSGTDSYPKPIYFSTPKPKHKNKVTPDPVEEGFVELERMAAKSETGATEHYLSEQGSSVLNNNTKSKKQIKPKVKEETLQEYMDKGIEENKNSAKIAPQTFNWEDVHADRFVNSPCYKLLGFDPRLPFNIQDENYKICEHEKEMDTVKSIVIILIVILGAIGIILFGIKSVRSSTIKVD